MMRGKFICCLVVISGFLGLGFSSSAAAAPSVKIDISPTIISKNINPGQGISASLLLKNQGLEPFNYIIYSSPYGVKNETYQPVFEVLPGFANVSSWFSFNPSSGTLKPGEDSAIQYSINVPAGTSPGGYYAAVFAEINTRAIEPAKTQLQIRQRVGSLFYLTVNGKVYQKGKINSWHVPLIQSSPVTASLKLQNTGKLYYVSKVNVYFEDIFGHKRYSYSTQKIVIPKAIRQIAISWPNPPIFGLYKVTGSATIYGQKYLPTSYVLIVSTLTRWVLLFVLIGLALIFGLQNIIVSLLKNKPKKDKIKK